MYKRSNNTIVKKINCLEVIDTYSLRERPKKNLVKNS